MARRSPTAPTFVSEPLTRQHWLVLLVVTAIAAALRWWQLGDWSLWIDEAHTWRDATMGLDAFMRQDRVFYPVTFLLLRLLFGAGLLGFDEASLRLPFVLVGIVTVPIMAVCGRRLVGAWPAVIGAGLLAIDPWHLFWSQNARGYGLVMLATVIAINRAHAWLQTERPFDLYMGALALAVGAMSHPTAALVALGFVGFLFARHRLAVGSMWRDVLWLVVVLLLVLVALPWLVANHSPFQGFLRSKDDPSLVHFVTTAAYYFRPTVLLSAMLGLWLCRSVLGVERALLLACMVVVPVLALTAVGGQLAKVTARYAICILPVLLWLVGLLCVHVALLVSRLDQPRAVRLTLAGLLPLLVVVDLVPLDVAYFRDQHGQRALWREAAASVRERAGDRGLRVLTVNQATLLYYLRPRHWFVTDGDPYPDIDVLALTDWGIRGEPNEPVDSDGRQSSVHEPGAAAHLAWHQEQAAERNALFAVMVTMPELIEQDLDGAFAELLSQNYELALHLPCWVGPKDLSVYVYLWQP